LSASKRQYCSTQSCDQVDILIVTRQRQASGFVAVVGWIGWMELPKVC